MTLNSCHGNWGPGDYSLDVSSVPSKTQTICKSVSWCYLFEDNTPIHNMCCELHAIFIWSLYWPSIGKSIEKAGRIVSGRFSVHVGHIVAKAFLNCLRICLPHPPIQWASYFNINLQVFMSHPLFYYLSGLFLINVFPWPIPPTLSPL